MKISQIILAGTTLALSGCSEQKEKIGPDELRKENAQMITRLLHEYPKDQSFHSSNDKIGLRLKTTHPVSVIATVMTDANIRSVLKDMNADGAPDNVVQEDPITNRKQVLYDTNFDAKIDYIRTEELSTGNLIIETSDTNGDGRPDRATVPTSSGEKSIDIDPELEDEITMQNNTSSAANIQLFHTILKKYF